MMWPYLLSIALVSDEVFGIGSQDMVRKGNWIFVHKFCFAKAGGHVEVEVQIPASIAAARIDGDGSALPRIHMEWGENWAAVKGVGDGVDGASCDERSRWDTVTIFDRSAVRLGK